tara:strand:+ start:825 stop:989 length:165 start_codon:yes stop_codon:yes gene_type:complete
VINKDYIIKETYSNWFETEESEEEEPSQKDTSYLDWYENWKKENFIGDEYNNDE